MERKQVTSLCPFYLMAAVFVFCCAAGPRVVAANFQCIRSQCHSGAPTMQNALRLRMNDVESALRRCFPSFSFMPGVSDAQIDEAIGHLKKCNRLAANGLLSLVQTAHSDLVSGWHECCTMQSIGKRKRRDDFDVDFDDDVSGVDYESRRRNLLQRLLDIVDNRLR